MESATEQMEGRKSMWERGIVKAGKRWGLLIAAAALASVAPTGASAGAAEPVDLILYNAKVWTVDEANPRAEAVAVRGSRIVKVGRDREVLRLRDPATRTVDLGGRLVLPGFIDAHTHFENATEWFFEARLIDVNDEAEMLARLGEAVKRVPKGLWITGTDWSGIASRQKRVPGSAPFQSFAPSLAAVDKVAPDHPVLFQRFDGAYFANSRALELLRIHKLTPNPSGGEYHRDARGELTGMLLGTAGERAEKTLPPKSRHRTLIAARALMAELNRNGITGIHDIARVDTLSQNRDFHTFVERSHSDVSIFTDLRDRGELSVRVHPLLTLANWEGLAGQGIRQGAGDDLIRYGGLKAFIDGTLMFEPYANRPNYAGNFTFRVLNEEEMRADIVGADRAGLDVAMHVTGDKAHALLLDWYRAAMRANGPRDRRFRLIHAWYPSLEQISQAGEMGLFADITPHHMIREIDTVEKLLGPQRVKTAHAWRTMIDKGVRINIVSDWPGNFDRSHVSPLNPLENIYYAVTRQDLGRDPKKGWHPGEAMTIEEAIRAYTINPASASREEAIKGSIAEGKLADLVVLSKDILQLPPQDLLTTEVIATIFDGKMIYTKSDPASWAQKRRRAR